MSGVLLCVKAYEGGGGSGKKDDSIFVGYGYHSEDRNEKPEMLQRLWLTCRMQNAE